MQVSGNPNNIYMYVTQALPTHSKTFSSSQGGNEMEWNGVGIEILQIQSTLNLWRQDIPGGMTWGLWNTNCQFVCSTSSRLLCLQYNIPFSLRLRLQENTYYISNFRSLPEHCKIILAKTFCKHNLFSNIQLCSGSTGFSAENTQIQRPNRDKISRTVSTYLSIVDKNTFGTKQMHITLTYHAIIA